MSFLVFCVLVLIFPLPKVSTVLDPINLICLSNIGSVLSFCLVLVLLDSFVVVLSPPFLLLCFS